MKQQIYRQIIDLIRQAYQLAQKIGIRNLLQPRLVREIIIADLLGHEIIYSKRDADAHAIGNPNEKYEYLSCVEGGSGQLDRMFTACLRNLLKSVLSHLHELLVIQKFI